MSDKGGRKGGSSTRPQNSTAKGSRQHIRLKPREGIRLLPIVEYRFSKEDRVFLADCLRSQLAPDVVKRLLDEVEPRVEQYLTEKLRSGKASSASALRKRVQQLKERTVEITYELVRFADLNAPHDHDSMLIGSVIRGKWRSMHPDQTGFLEDTIRACNQLIEVLDLMLDDSESFIEHDLQVTLSNDTPWKPLYIYFASRLADARRKLIPRRGAPRKSAEVNLIKDIAVIYQDTTGLRPTKSQVTAFYNFVQGIFEILPHRRYDRDIEHRRLIETAIDELNRQ